MLGFGEHRPASMQRPSFNRADHVQIPDDDHLSPAGHRRTRRDTLTCSQNWSSALRRDQALSTTRQTVLHSQ
jgi:hypothetical protein